MLVYAMYVLLPARDERFLRMVDRLRAFGASNPADLEDVGRKLVGTYGCGKDEA